MEIKDTLFIIPARGGSKGLLRKNILPINGKPMIYYTIDAARGATRDENICVSTDDDEIRQVVEEYGLKVPFMRPSALATDFANSRDVLLHAIDFYKNKLGRAFVKACLLQPTSPLRTSDHLIRSQQLWKDDLDMLVSVKQSKANPYFSLFEEQEDGYLKKSKEGDFLRRQDAPKIWEFNGAIYYINIKSLYAGPISDFRKVAKFEMSEEESYDVDTRFDFELINLILKIKN